MVQEQLWLCALFGRLWGFNILEGFQRSALVRPSLKHQATNQVEVPSGFDVLLCLNNFLTIMTLAMSASTTGPSLAFGIYLALHACMHIYMVH